MKGCTRCFTEAELRILGGDPRDVPDDVLEGFMGKVVDHWDTDQYPVLWRRLIPRALRRWGPEGPGTDPSHELRGLGRYGAELISWPVAERTAVEQVFRALLTLALTGGRSPADIRDLVEGVAHATGGLEPWLDHIDGFSGPAADAASSDWHWAGGRISCGRSSISRGGTTATRESSPTGCSRSDPASRPSRHATHAARTPPTHSSRSPTFKTVTGAHGSTPTARARVLSSTWPPAGEVLAFDWCDGRTEMLV
ncbi:hypothetical protein ACFQ51_41105 [Streptomyces kaempferi]